MICPAADLLPNGPAAQTVVPCEGALCVATLICLFPHPPFITDFLAAPAGPPRCVRPMRPVPGETCEPRFTQRLDRELGLPLGGEFLWRLHYSSSSQRIPVRVCLRS